MTAIEILAEELNRRHKRLGEVKRECLVLENECTALKKDLEILRKANGVDLELEIHVPFTESISQTQAVQTIALGMTGKFTLSKVIQAVKKTYPQFEDTLQKDSAYQYVHKLVKLGNLTTQISHEFGGSLVYEKATK